MEAIFKLLLTLNSLLLSLIVFLVKEQIVITPLHSYFSVLPDIFSFCFYFLVVLIFTWLILKFSNYLGTDTIASGSISAIEPANDSFLPSYLGYFFVALSVPNIKVFIFVFCIIFVFIYYSRVSYFNPVFFLLGFNFYYVTNIRNIKILLITKRQIRNHKNTEFDNLKRINNYTFIDMER